MANGKIGHFKFVNVEEIKGSEKRRAYKLNPFVSSTIEKEIQAESNYSSDDQSETSIYDILKSRLNESNGTLNLSDVIKIIGLSDTQYLNILSINGYNDIKCFSEVGNKDTLIEIGISDCRIQHVLLKAAQILRNYKSYQKKPSFKSYTSSQKYFFPKRRETVTQSAPSTPAIEFSSDFSELISKLESVSTSSLDNNYDEIQHFSTITTSLRRNSQSSVKEFCNLNENFREENNSDYKDQTIYENNDQIIVVTHEQNSGTLGKEK